MKQTRERLTVEVPVGWKAQLAEIGKKMERNTSYLTRKALEQAHPELKKNDR
jgi:hypothetical protein